jgi:antitoxin (DNA-binding transcriptional repressor) of toxin-antitoxin stability system
MTTVSALRGQDPPAPPTARRRALRDHGKPVAQLGPVEEPRRSEDIAAVIERMKRARALRLKVTVEQILTARDEGRKP